MPRQVGWRNPYSVYRLQTQSGIHLKHLPLQKQPGNAWIYRQPKSQHVAIYRRVMEAHGRHRTERYKRKLKSPNDGHTVAVKDNIVTSSLPTSSSSNILRGYVAPESATIVQILQKAGVECLGKTNMDEFGMGSHSLNSAFGPVFNSHDRVRRSTSVGGSSGGSALVVANNHCHFAIGTDTGGSVRLPAAYTNIIGFKPSYGLISRNGVVPYANSLDTVGIMAKSCVDILLVFRELNQPDPKDPTCLTEPSRERIQQAKNRRFLAAHRDPLRKITLHDRIVSMDELRTNPQTYSHLTSKEKYRLQLRRRRTIGFPVEFNIQELQPEIRTAWINTLSMLIKEHHVVVPVSLPSIKQALSAYYVIAPAEASSNLAKYDGIRYGKARGVGEGDDGVLYSKHRGDMFGDEVKRRIVLGSFSLSAGAMDNYFIQAQKVRRMLQQDFDQVFRMPNPLQEDAQVVSNGVDLIVCPTAPTFPPTMESLKDADPIESYMNDVFTVPASLAGLPAISVPMHPDQDTHMPVEKAMGIQLIGQYGDDYSVIQFAHRYLENRMDWTGIGSRQAIAAKRIK